MSNISHREIAFNSVTCEYPQEIKLKAIFPSETYDDRAQAKCIPLYLVGSLYRLFPSVFDIKYTKGSILSGRATEEILKFSHLFDGLPLLVCLEFEVEGGKGSIADGNGSEATVTLTFRSRFTGNGLSQRIISRESSAKETLQKAVQDGSLTLFSRIYQCENHGGNGYKRKTLGIGSLREYFNYGGFNWKNFTSEVSKVGSCNSVLHLNLPLGEYLGSSNENELMAMGMLGEGGIFLRYDKITLEAKKISSLPQMLNEDSVLPLGSSANNIPFVCPHFPREQQKFKRDFGDGFEFVSDIGNEDEQSRSSSFCTPSSSNLFNDKAFMLSFQWNWPFSKYRVSCIGRHDKSQHPGSTVATFSAPPCFIHSFCITDNYVIIPWIPCLFIENPRSGKPLLEILQWFPERDSEFYIISKDLGELVCIYRSAPFLVMHWSFAIENQISDEIELFANVYEDDSILHAYSLDSLRQKNGNLPVSKNTLSSLWNFLTRRGGQVRPSSSSPSTHFPSSQLKSIKLENLSISIARFEGSGGVMPISHPLANIKKISESPCEMSCINESALRRSKTICHMWGMSIAKEDRSLPGMFWNSLVQVSLPSCFPETGLANAIVKEWKKTGEFPGEPIFIPAQGPFHLRRRTLSQLCKPTTIPENTEKSQLPISTQQPRAIGKVHDDQNHHRHGIIDDKDGVLLSVVLNCNENKSYLVAIDANEMKEIVRWELPHVLPLNMSHGVWEKKLW